jgi:hypothetical protein
VNRLAAPQGVILFAGLFLFLATSVALVGSRRPAVALAVPARIGSR